MITTDKEASTYTHFIEVISRNAKKWNPSAVMADFEEAEWQGISAVFEDCTVLGCWFHLKQSIQRWLLSKFFF